MKLTSIASNAFDTARSTFKAMADAAGPQGEDATKQAELKKADNKQVVPAQAAEKADKKAVKAIAKADSEEQQPTPAKKRRQGSNLDSYA
jgi:hypothetical protein